MNINDDDLFDSEGYLLASEPWSKEVAISVAKKNKIELNDSHWIVINCLRSFYSEYNIIPTNRALINLVRKENKGFSSIDFQALFTNSPIQTACMIAGLPKPDRCI